MSRVKILALNTVASVVKCNDQGIFSCKQNVEIIMKKATILFTFASSLGVAIEHVIMFNKSEIKPLEPDRGNAREGRRRRALLFVGCIVYHGAMLSK